MSQPTAALPRDVGSLTRPDMARDPVMVVTTWVAGAAAAVASFAALYELARHTGWPWYTAWLYPLTIDSYAVAALRVWLGRGTRSGKARRRAAGAAVLAIIWSVAGNAAFHAAVAHVYVITWWMVVAVSATPPVVLGLVSHLFALRSQPVDPAPGELADIAAKPAELDVEELPVPTDADLAAMTKTEAIKIALTHTNGQVLDAQRWLVEHGGISAHRSFIHDVRRGVSGKGRRHRSAPAVTAQPGEVAA